MAREAGKVQEGLENMRGGNRDAEGTAGMFSDDNESWKNASTSISGRLQTNAQLHRGQVPLG